MSTAKLTFGTPTAFAITLASLATSTAGVGRQATMIDNSTNGYLGAQINGYIKQGTSPTGNKSVGIYLLRSDGTRRTDNAGASDAGITLYNAECLGRFYNKAAPSTGDVIYVDCHIPFLGKEWTIALVHDTAVNLDSTEGNHSLYWTGYRGDIA